MLSRSTRMTPSRTKSSPGFQNVELVMMMFLGGRVELAATGAGSVGLVGYDWEYVQPLREGIEYRVEGGIVSAERTVAPTGAHHDNVAFSIELFDGASLCARVTNRWVFRRPL